MVGEARELFARVFGSEPAGVAVAPGRVNLIGEHTDYNDGFVLPMAIDRGVAVAFAPRADALVRVHAGAFGETRDLTPGLPAPASRTGWLAYVAGIVWAMRRAGLPPGGADLAIVSDLPIGAGLSSSAALELAAARALAAASALPWDARRAALLAREAENTFVGVACGIMDQFASAMGEAGSALLLDCRSLETRQVPLPPESTVVVMDTGVRRALASSAYNDRRAACLRAVAAVQAIEPGVRALRDVELALLARARTAMDDEAFRRASHVVGEIARPRAMADALAAGDLVAAGRLMDESHASLRDLYDVSCPELDAIVAAARSHPSCPGARLTGAGFGGCAIALVASRDAEAFVKHVTEGYARAVGREATVFAARPSAGAHVTE